MVFYINIIYSLGLKLLSINCMLTTMHTKFEVLFLFKIGKVKFKILGSYVPCQTRHVIFDLITVFANELIELVPKRMAFGMGIVIDKYVQMSEAAVL